MRLIKSQGTREVYTVTDFRGNSGKSFFSEYLNILYNFQLLNGTITERDAAFMIDIKANGFYFDVKRSSTEMRLYAQLY